MENIYIEFEKALEVVLSNVPSLPTEKISLFDSLHRVLAEEILADRDNPPASVSAMDGYGVRFEDIKAVPARLKIVDDIPAGKLSKRKIEKGEAVKIFTGSIIPEGCDTVVPVEYTKEENDFVTIEKNFPKGSNIRKQGEDYKKDSTVLEKGTFITPIEMGVLASVNKTHIKVSVKPRVGIVVTGNEIIEPGEEIKEVSMIRNSNAYTLYGLVKEAGGEPVYFGIVDDDKEKTKKTLIEAFEICDLVVTSGGISMGDYDFIKAILPEIGVETLFYKLKIKPGKPVFFGKRGKKFIFSLPGFPVSTVINFYNFVFPFIRRMLGAQSIFRKKVKGVLAEEFKRKKSNRMEFARCKYVYDVESGEYKVFPLRKQGSGILSAMTGNVGLMVVPIGTDYIPTGELVDLILIKEL
ncbi:molybdenum cofactor synthesis domain protein [Desulfurobacterium thermolithotrophum DSM 11699]|uniref:Molybdopterin molybdenumtransferase n=1 Tax=Desulfurobacterium thermolithotrophum (strain DSM 11699 / BSA) TaxID=868864 RepID=F0S3P4_DESTD|nr:gephyrin-like molybdotransferase Glp [Desulfurobacterium thermolithotrophum]ADY73466.1 molybdenum cofactor synthesis domain protein [Desulfurobacterium thermolithotrophum DSM 11699]